MSEILVQPLEDMETLASEISADIRRRGSRQFAQTVKSAWADLEPTISEQSGEIVTVPSSALMKFMKEAQGSSNSIRDRILFNRFVSIFPDGTPGGGDLHSLTGLISHDIAHVAPTMWFLGICQTAYSKREGERCPFTKDWIDFLKRSVNKAEELANVQALIVDYVGGVAALDRKQEVPSAPFPIVRTMEGIGYMIKGRFSHDDYELLTNPAVIPETARNRIIVRANEGLVLNAAQSFIFCDLYNLAKNSAKAVEKKFLDRNIPLTESAIKRRLRGEPFLGEPSMIVMTASETEDSLVLTVDDTGVGLSLDKALARIHDIIEGIQSSGKDISGSGWYKSMDELGLKEDADLFVLWPTQPQVIRAIRIGTLYDTLFSSAFEDFGWGGFGSITSNFGLWGLNYLTGKLKGTVMGTNKFDGGALFTVILPKSSVGL